LLKSDVVCQNYGDVYSVIVFSWTRCRQGGALGNAWWSKGTAVLYTLCLRNAPNLKRYSSKLLTLMAFGRNIQKTLE